MIGKLKGIIDSIDSDQLILDVSGVGYLVSCSSKTISALPSIGEAASLLIHMQVKEDDISLYGFIEKIEQDWFNLLVTVQGIGPKLALVILSSLSPNELITVIIDKSKEHFKHISGVGPKLAERIFTELHKSANLYVSKNPNLLSKTGISNENITVVNDALSALTSLGYARHQANNICKNIVSNNPEISLNDLIRLALKELAAS